MTPEEEAAAARWHRENPQEAATLFANATATIATMPAPSHPGTRSPDPAASYQRPFAVTQITAEAPMRLIFRPSHYEKW